MGGTVNKHRIGRFYIQSTVIQDDPLTIAKGFWIMKCVPVRVEKHWWCDAVEYVGLSELFDELEGGQKIPEYDVIFEVSGQGPRAKVSVTVTRKK